MTLTVHKMLTVWPWPWPLNFDLLASQLVHELNEPCSSSGQVLAFLSYSALEVFLRECAI